MNYGNDKDETIKELTIKIARNNIMLDALQKKNSQDLIILNHMKSEIDILQETIKLKYL